MVVSNMFNVTLFGEEFQFGEHILQMGCFNHQLDIFFSHVLIFLKQFDFKIFT